MENSIRQETLLFVIDKQAGRVLLAMKKVRFGAGKWNGTGGRVEEGETPEEAAVREAKEEVGITLRGSHVESRGAIEFSFEGKPDWTRHVHLFVSSAWEGKPMESEEMAPQWFELDSVPYERMWIDDALWLPQLLAGQSIDASFRFNADGSAILDHHVRAY